MYFPEGLENTPLTAHTINCVCHSIGSMFRVLWIYNFEIILKTYLWLILISNDHNTPIFPVQKASNSFLFWRCKDCCYHTPFCAIPPSVFWNCLYCDDCTVVKFSQIWRKGSKWQSTEFLARSSLRQGPLNTWTVHSN